MDEHHRIGSGSESGPPDPGREMGEMPLSEDEQRILREIEENLSATDPKLVQQVSDTTLYRHSARVIKWAVVGFIAGLLLMVFTFTTTLILGVVGFLVMLGCALAIEHNVRKLGRGGHGEPHRLDAQRRARRTCSATPAVAGASVRPRRPAVLSGRRSRGLHRDPGRPALGVQHRAARRLAPHRSGRPRRRRSRRARTRSAISSRCAWSASLLDAGAADAADPASGDRAPPHR